MRISGSLRSNRGWVRQVQALGRTETILPLCVLLASDAGASMTGARRYSRGRQRKPMDFTITTELADLRARIADFVDRHILPLEADPAAYDTHENIAPAVLEPLRQKARDAGLWCLQLSPEAGGRGLGKMGMAVCYEAMNRSIFGPVA